MSDTSPLVDADHSAASQEQEGDRAGDQGDSQREDAPPAAAAAGAAAGHNAGVAETGAVASSGPDADMDIIFRRLPTVPWAALATCTNLVMLVMVFLLPVFCDRPRIHEDDDDPRDPPTVEKCKVSSFSILVYAHCLHWLTHLIVDQRLKSHHKKSRVRGYLEFYIKTKNIRRTPFYLVSFCNAILLITTTALTEYCEHSECKDKLFKVDYLRVVVTLFALVTMCIWGNYIINIREFNKKKKLPDVLRTDARRRLMLNPDGDGAEGGDGAAAGGAATASPSPAGPPTRYVTVDPGDELRTVEMIRDEIIEMQAEILRYFQDRVEGLNLKVLDQRRQIRRLATALQEAQEAAVQVV